MTWKTKKKKVVNVQQVTEEPDEVVHSNVEEPVELEHSQIDAEEPDKVEVSVSTLPQQAVTDTVTRLYCK